MKKTFIVDGNFADSRFDKWFKKNVCDVPQSLIEKNIRKGKIKINNKKIKSSYKLKINDKIIIFNLNFKAKESKKEIYIPNKKDLQFSNKMFIENNENFVVINKPSGIAVQSGTKSLKNILDILRKTKEFLGSSPYAVHRIDKETTGILLVAKNRKYAQLFTSLFRIRKIYKTYLGIVLGELNNKKGILEDVLFDYSGNKIIKSKAVTHFKVIDSKNNYSLLELNPITGRKHQIRKQLLMHGHPILGDDKYRISKKHVKNNNLMLHAYKIKFIINDEKYNFSAEPSDIFKKTLTEKMLKIH